MGTVCTSGIAVGVDNLTPVELRCEYLQNPLGIDVVQPRLSWRLESKVRGQKQTAYRILVASSAEKLKQLEGDLLDTGKINSNQTNQIAYAGRALTKHMQCFWKVMAWDMYGKPSNWSNPAHWSMGLLNSVDWKADWIGFDQIEQSKPASNLKKKAVIKKAIYGAPNNATKRIDVTEKLSTSDCRKS